MDATKTTDPEAPKTIAALESNWKIRALAAHLKDVRDMREEMAERQAVEHEQRRQSHLDWLTRIVGSDDAIRANISDDGLKSELDGATFAMLRDDHIWRLHMYEACSDCGSSRYSYALREPQDIGRFLDDHEDRYHECHPPRPAAQPNETAAPPAPTDAERALALVRELVNLVHVHESQE